jgi:hypothetical protein
VPWTLIFGNQTPHHLRNCSDHSSCLLTAALWQLQNGCL